MGVLCENTIIGASGAGGYTIDQSLRFNDDDSPMLTRTPSVAGNRKIWTYSFWTKRGVFDTNQYFLDQTTGSDDSSYMHIHWHGGNNWLRLSGWLVGVHVASKQRDIAGWYHIVIAVDTTQATETNRIKMYINGELQTLTGTYYSQNADTPINATALHRISGAPLDGYLAEVNFIDGQALDPSHFGEYNSVYNNWVAKKYTGAYGTNGFYLNFGSNLAYDQSGNGNNWVAHNLDLNSDFTIKDTPSNNFPTFSSAYGDNLYSGSNVSGCKLHLTNDGTSDNNTNASMAFPKTGKWYYEVRFVGNTAMYGEFGIGNLDKGNFSTVGYNNSWLGDGSNNGHTLWYWSEDQSGNYQGFWNGHYNGPNGSNRLLNTWSNFGAGVADGTHIFRFAVDRDAGKLYFGWDGTWRIGDADDLSGGISIPNNDDDWGIVNSFWNSSGSADMFYNFGQDGSFDGYTTSTYSDDNNIGNFKYDVPDGFLALCTQNLPDPDVIPSEHFAVGTYTGNGSTQSITGLGFQPDLVWVKNRDGSYSHMLFDVIRGTSKQLQSNATAAEETISGVTSFDSDGFGIGSNAAGNGNNNSIVYWAWKANGSPVSNTDGSITSQVSANVDAGFSVVKYPTDSAEQTVGHGLSKAPELVITKALGATSSWDTWFTGFNDYQAVMLNSTAAKYTNSGARTVTSTSSSTIGFGLQMIGSDYYGVGNEMIAYCFHSVEGYSKVGSYHGGGTADDAVFVYTGFKPAYLMLKATNRASAPWVIYDVARDTHNQMTNHLEADSAGAEQTDLAIDFLSNGFKPKSVAGDINTADGEYIYMAFAETDFKNSNAR